MNSGPGPDPQMSRPTMKDVAALARVSLKTVSRVINDEPTVNEEMAQRVQRAVKQLRFQPHAGAVALRRRDRRSSTIGVLLEDLSNPFSATIYRIIEEVATERGISVLGGSLDESTAREHELVTLMMRHRVDGVIIAPASHDHQYLLRDQEAGVPFVFIDRGPVLLKADSVRSDSHKASAEAVTHLVNVGHRRIAYLGGDGSIATSRERHQGYMSALKDAGLAVDEFIVAEDIVTIDGAYERATKMLASEKPPTAFFTGQNLVTIGTVQAIREMGKQRQIALVGFDDFLLADLLEPALTVVAQDVSTIGKVAAQKLFARISGDVSPTTDEIIPTRLIVRGSGEIPPS